MAKPTTVTFGGVEYPLAPLTFRQIQAIGPAFWKGMAGDEDAFYLGALICIEIALKIDREVVENTPTDLEEIATAVNRIAVVAGLLKEPDQDAAPGEVAAGSL